MQFSKFGEKFTRPSGITQLMKDLGQANQANDPEVCMLGGGNPAQIPEAQAIFKKEMAKILDDQQFKNMVGLYDGPKGEQRFISVLADYLNNKFGWGISEKNIALSNGSQNSFFYLFNLLAGEMPSKKGSSSFKKVLFPIAPEYVGYSDLGLSEAMFSSVKPNIELIGDQQFKYRVDFESSELNDKLLGKNKGDVSDYAAITLSRPTNPTGNVITDNELAQLNQLAEKAGIPLILDNAYGQPFPNVIHREVSIPWNQNMVLCMSLSKLGLPGARTGIVVANEELIEAISRVSGIITLAPNSVGAALMTRMLLDDEMSHLCEGIIKPFYAQKVDYAVKLFNELFADFPIRLHVPEGAFFLWIWLDGLPISTKALYERLKARKVYIIPGEEFFIGLEEPWAHTRQCIRINYARPEAELRRGLSILLEELRQLY